MSVCMFLMHAQTTELIFMKVGTGVLLHQGGVLVGVAMFACARARAHVRKRFFSHLDSHTTEPIFMKFFRDILLPQGEVLGT